MTRHALLPLALLAACASAPRPTLAYDPALAVGQCDLEDDDNLVTIDASNDAIETGPVIWFQERLVGYIESPMVTLAMWADGRTIFSTGWRDNHDLGLQEARPGQLGHLLDAEAHRRGRLLDRKLLKRLAPAQHQVLRAFVVPRL